jgi:DNA-binding response OmpR family regulator
LAELVKPRVLIVDDDESLLATIASFLAREGFCAEASSNVYDAVARMGCENFEFLVLDLMLGDRTGEDLLHFLTVSLGTQPKRIVLITGQPELFEHSRFRGEVSVLPKPFSLQDLLSALSRSSEPRTRDAEPKGLFLAALRKLLQHFV